MLRSRIAISAATLGIAVCSSSYGQVAEGIAPPQLGDTKSAPAASAPVRASPSAISVDADKSTERTSDLLERYRTRELRTRFSFWKQQEVYRAEKPMELGYFGGNYQDIFAGSPAALDSMSTYRTLRIAGTAAYVVGLGLLVADLVLLANGSSSVVGRNARGEINSAKPLYWGLLIPGGVLGFSGIFAMQGANAYLSDAIDQYNSDLATQLRRGASSSNSLRFSGISYKGNF
jgi:hypothetical protein